MLLIDGLNINIEILGNGTKSVLLLHGWGQSTKAFINVSKHLEKKFTVYNIDLPGFGLSEKPETVFNTEDYANFIRKIITYYKIENPIIIGHSFGGRIAIKYASMFNDVDKMVLIDSAGIVPKRTIKYYIKIYSFKILKKIYKLKMFRNKQEKLIAKFASNDYKNADKIMRAILVKVVNEDLRQDMELIECPVLLVWGTNDKVTPLGDAYIMKKHLSDCGIVEIKDAGHFSYLENLSLFLKVLDVFL